MSQRRLIDTNLIVRHLTQDHARHAAAAHKLFAACDRGDLTLVVLPSVLAECVFVLESFYKHPRQDIGQTLSMLINSPGIEITDLPIHLDALRRYQETKLHFIDCTLAAFAAATAMSIATFDTGFRKFVDVRIELEPE